MDIERRNPKINNVYLETGSFFSVLVIIDPTMAISRSVLFGARIDLSLFSELSKRGKRSCVDGPDRRSPDVGQDQFSHASSPRLARDVERGCVTSGSASEADRTVPSSRLGEHQIGARRPSWELEELRRPNDLSANGLDQNET